jgi:hypothetical protein
MSIDLKKLADDVFADVVYPSKGTEDAFCDQHNKGLFQVLARQVAAAVKHEDAKRCDMYIRLLDSCGHAAEADEVRHLQRHFLEDADAIGRGDEGINPVDSP